MRQMPSVGAGSGGDRAAILGRGGIGRGWSVTNFRSHAVLLNNFRYMMTGLIFSWG
jgi:hypothetical protein